MGKSAVMQRIEIKLLPSSKIIAPAIIPHSPALNPILPNLRQGYNLLIPTFKCLAIIAV